MEILRLKEVLSQKGFTSKWLSDKLNISPGYISDIVRHKKTPSIETLVQIAEALDVDICDLFKRSKAESGLQIAERMEQDLVELKKLL
ncbi:MAG: helix-turn-helix transcriptional regulator [Saprospiraceae bacterium]|nr:helix-turn-helix transcriptional regulator [Saprospiraceae bacterium]